MESHSRTESHPRFSFKKFTRDLGHSLGRAIADLVKDPEQSLDATAVFGTLPNIVEGDVLDLPEVVDDDVPPPPDPLHIVDDVPPPPSPVVDDVPPPPVVVPDVPPPHIPRTQARTRGHRRPQTTPIDIPWFESRELRPRALGVRSMSRRRRREDDDDDSALVPSRHGDVVCRGKALEYLKEFHPTRWRVPSSIPIREEVEIWGRKWIVKESSLGGEAGLGVFACQDIPVGGNINTRTMADWVPLFPYCGSIYSWGHWSVITKAMPGAATYSLSADSASTDDQGRHLRHVPRGQRRMIDGDPVRSCNIAGYINSSVVTRDLRDLESESRPVCRRVRGRAVHRENVKWVFEDGPPEGCAESHAEFHIMTYAIRPIAAGAELIASYGLTH